MKNQLLIILLLFLSSCYTLDWGYRKVDKVNRKQPTILPEYCSERYNDTDSFREEIKYLPGEIQYLPGDSIPYQVDCDSVPKGKPKIVYLPSKARVDTFKQVLSTSTSNTALQQILQLRIDSSNKEVQNKQLEISKFEEKVRIKNKQIAISYSIIGAILLAFIAWIYIKKF